MKFTDEEKRTIQDLKLAAAKAPILHSVIMTGTPIGKDLGVILRDRFWIVYTLEQNALGYLVPHMSATCRNDLPQIERWEFDAIKDAFGFGTDLKKQLISTIPAPGYPGVLRYSILEYPDEMFKDKRIANLHFKREENEANPL
jgi:hypothetical protein